MEKIGQLHAKEFIIFDIDLINIFLDLSSQQEKQMQT